jgi:hypothetical protein
MVLAAQPARVDSAQMAEERISRRQARARIVRATLSKMSPICFLGTNVGGVPQITIQITLHCVSNETDNV